jgi:hypothetical protein
MKRTVLVFGFISGALIILFMSGTMFFVKDIGFDKGEIVGYTGMVLAFLLVFFGIRSYRENVGGGKISFGRAFAVGLLIMLISSACYVAAWEVIYFKVMHASMQDFVQKYQAHEVEKVRNSGGGEAAVQAKLQEMKKMMALYQNPFFNAAITFLEPLPPGLIMTLLSALILRKKKKPHDSAMNLPATQAAS